MGRIALVALLGLIGMAMVAPTQAATMIGIHQGLEGDSNYGPELLALEAQLGRPAVIDADNVEWADFPDTTRIAWDMKTGHIPMETWKVEFTQANPNACATANAIMAGTYDTQLTKQATAIKSYGGTILVRWNPEMTGNAENTCFTGFPIDNNLPLAGQKFIGAWRHLVSLFRAVGATNVQWIFGPSSGAFFTKEWGYFYPGPGYVDWIGMDIYNFTDIPATYQNIQGAIYFYPEVSGLGKHIMVSDAGAFNDPTMNPDAQTMFINTSRAYLKGAPAVDAYIWWNAFNPLTPPPPPYNGTGYILTGAGLAAFKALANDPFYTTTWAQWTQDHGLPAK